MAKQTRLNFFDKLFLWLNILLGAALLISYLAPVIDPRKAWIIAFFGLAYPFLLLGNCLLILYWLLRRSKYALLSVIIILVGFNVLRDNIGFRFADNLAARKTGGANLRVMTYNVHFFKRYGDDNDVTTKTHMLAIINQQQPDVIGFQEFFNRPKGKYAIKDSLKKILHTDQYYIEPFGGNNGYELLGMAIFSKFPIVSHGMIRLSDEPGSGNQCLYIDVKKANRTFRFYSVHLQSIRFEAEDYDYLKKVSHKGEPNFYSSKRIGSKLKKAFLKRSEQVFKVKAHAAQCPYPYVISGDFNDTPASFALSQMSKGVKNAFREKGTGLGRTYNGSFPNYQIDYILTSNNMDVDNYQIIKQKLSDHYPVRSDLILK